MNRRHFLTAASCAAGSYLIGQKPPDHFPFGPMGQPRPIPMLPVTGLHGEKATLAQVVHGHVTALQLMFTGCNATCPVQGAIFAQAQKELNNSIQDARFVSLSIDPQNDTPAAMTQWLETFHARPGWTGYVPELKDMHTLFQLFGEGGLPRPKGSDPHNGQVYLISRAGNLVFRTASMPRPEEIVRSMKLVATLKDSQIKPLSEGKRSMPHRDALVK